MRSPNYFIPLVVSRDSLPRHIGDERLSGHEHLEIYVRADSDSSSSNNTELLARRDGPFALSNDGAAMPRWL
jgi:hypothetical protein